MSRRNMMTQASKAEQKKLDKREKKRAKYDKISPKRFKQFIVIKLMRGRNLAIRDNTGFSDPYVIMTYKKQKYRSNIIEQNLNPVWNESYCFGIEKLEGEIYCEVWDWDKITSDDRMGECNLSLQGLELDVPKQQWVNLVKVESGKILISLTLREKSRPMKTSEAVQEGFFQGRKQSESKISFTESSTSKIQGIGQTSEEISALVNVPKFDLQQINLTSEPKLEFLYGYHGWEGRTNVRWCGTDDVFYFSGATGIILNIGEEEITQRFFYGHTEPIYCCDVDSLNSLIVTGDNSGKIIFWNSLDFQILKEFQIPSGVEAIKMSNDKKFLIAIGNDRSHTIYCWNLLNGDQLFTKEGHENKVLDVAFYPDNQTFVTCGIHHLQIHQGTNRTTIESPTLLLSVEVTNQEILVSNREGELLSYSLTGEFIGKIKAHTGPCVSIKLAYPYLITGGKDGKICVWELSTKNRIRRIDSVVGGPIRSVDYFNNKFIIGTNKNQIWICGDETEAMKIVEPHSDEIHGLDSSPDGIHFITSSDDRTIRVFDASKHQTMGYKSINGQARFVAYSPNAQMIAIGLRDGEFVITDYNLKQIANRKDSHTGVVFMKFSPDSSILGILYNHGEIVFYECSQSFRRLSSINTNQIVFSWGIDSKHIQSETGIYNVENGDLVTSELNISFEIVDTEGSIRDTRGDISVFAQGTRIIVSSRGIEYQLSPEVPNIASVKFLGSQRIIAISSTEQCSYQWIL